MRGFVRLATVVLTAALCSVPALVQAAAPCSDEDQDTICDLDEDTNGNGDLDDDDTDLDGTPDWRDPDDDGDGVPTADEDSDGSGTPLDDDVDEDGLPDYLDTSVPTDDDLDGYIDAAYGGDDCDDTQPAIHPGVFDPLYDGADWDCDGADDFDGDFDGYQSLAEAEGGDDCDDTDPDINPGMSEDLSDIDRDCDGWTDPTRSLVARGGCDCQAASPAGGWGWLALAPVLVLRRRA